jgi:hypothetical protein
VQQLETPAAVSFTGDVASLSTSVVLGAGVPNAAFNT